MRNFFVTFMASLLSCSAAFAFWPEAADSSFELGVGYRRDKLSWETQAGTNVADIPVELTSKLQWKDLNIWQIDARFKYVTCDNIYFRASADYGWITHGRVTDKDYVSVASSATSSFTSSFDTSGSDAIEFASVSARADRGHVYDADIAVGYQFKLCDYSLAFTPVVGYSWSGQHLEIGGNDDSYYSSSSSSTSIPPLVAGTSSSSSLSNLDSRYNTRWNGPFIGFDVDYQLWCDWTLFASYEFHWARYHAKARWDLRSDLLDGFNHRAKSAYGNVAAVGLKYDFCECWTLGVVGEWKWFCAHKGQDRALIAEGTVGDVETRCFLYTPLRNVYWQSASVSVNIGMMF